MINRAIQIGWRGYLLWGVCAYCCLLVANLPVAWLYARMAPATLPLQWTQLQGTPWSGQAQQMAIGPLTIGPVQWQFLWHTLWTGRLSVALQWYNGSESLNQVIVGMLATTNPAQPVVFLEQGEFNLSLAWLTAQPAFLSPGSTGQIHATLNALLLDIGQKKWRQLQGSSELTNIRIGSPMNLPLGDFQLQIYLGEQGVVHVTIQDRQAPLRIKATVQWQLDGHYRVRGTIAPQDPTNERLLALLRLIGQPGPDGRTTLDLTGTLRF